MKSKIAQTDWKEWVESLITDAGGKESLLLYIYTQEQMWDRYIEYLRKHPQKNLLEDAPKQVFELYKEEFIKLYTECVVSYFDSASDRNSYRYGASMLETLIGYGGSKEAYEIIEQQKARRPRRPALIDELSKIEKRSVSNNSDMQITLLRFAYRCFCFMPMMFYCLVR